MTDAGHRGLAVRYAALFAGEIVSKICLLVAFGHLARVFSPADYGVIELALSLTLFFVLGVEGGMGAYGAKMAAADPSALPAIVPRIMLLRALIGVPAYLVVVAVANVSNTPGIGILLITGIAILITPFLTQWVFQGLGRMGWVALGSVVRYGIFAAAVLLLVRPGASINAAAFAEIAGLGALAILNGILLFGRIGLRLDARGSVAGARRLIGDVWPLALSDLSWACLWYSPAIVTGWVSAREEVAWIGASMRLVIAAHTFVWLYFFNLLPALTVEISRGVVQWRALVGRSMRTSMWPAALVGVATTLAAPTVMPMIYGEAFTRAILPLQIVIWIIPIAWLSGHYRFSLIAAGKQRWELAALAVSAVFTVILATQLGRLWGSAGVASAFVAGGALNAVLAAVASSRRIGASGDFGEVALVFAAATVTVGFGLFVSSWSTPFAGTLAGAGIFTAVALWRNAAYVRSLF